MRPQAQGSICAMVFSESLPHRSPKQAPLKPGCGRVQASPVTAQSESGWQVGIKVRIGGDEIVGRDRWAQSLVVAYDFGALRAEEPGRRSCIVLAAACPAPAPSGEMGETKSGNLGILAGV